MWKLPLQSWIIGRLTIIQARELLRTLSALQKFPARDGEGVTMNVILGYPHIEIRRVGKFALVRMFAAKRTCNHMTAV